MIISIQNNITGNMVVCSDEETAKNFIEGYIKNQIPFNVDYGRKL